MHTMASSVRNCSLLEVSTSSDLQISGLILGLALATAITNIVKVTVGRPRPDLIDRCASKSH